ncbi:MAG TPA: DUF3089 domain-containing protein [Solirubrobacteraceae bacterium]
MLLRVACLATVGSALVAVASARASTVWLCRPSQVPDPCTPGLSTTVYSPSLTALRVIHPRAAKPPAIDCFYVYPTVSQQPTTNANLHIDPEERSIALYQAARYSQYCRVFAPMYRQLTLKGILSKRKLTPAQLALSLGGVRSAFRTYLGRYNSGRGFVLIGDSQGAFVLRELIARDVDGKPAVRRRLLSAILLGGNVLVKRGRGVGGDFKHIPACRSAHQLACVIAFSTFDGPVPARSLFGRTQVAGMQVLCTNPAAVAGGSETVEAILPSEPFAPGTLIAAGIKVLGLTQPHPPTIWASLPGSYMARCSSAGGATVLQVSALPGAQTARPSPDATWGLHLIDANIALGDLVRIVHIEATAFAKRGAA